MKMVPKISYSVLTSTNLEIEDANYISAGTDPACLRFVVGEGGKMLNISGAARSEAFLSYNKQLDLLKFR